MFVFLFELKDWVQPFGPMKSFLSVLIPTLVYHCYFILWLRRNNQKANFHPEAIVGIKRKHRILNFIDWFLISLCAIQFVASALINTLDSH